MGAGSDPMVGSGSGQLREIGSETWWEVGRGRGRAKEREGLRSRLTSACGS